MIGVLSHYDNPTGMIKFLSLVSKAKGIDLIFFRIKDIDQQNNVINGKTLVDNNWIEITTEIPRVIEVSSYCLKYKNELEYLNKYAFLTNSSRNRMSKATFQKKLEEDSHLKKYVIPSEACTSFSVIEKFLSNYNKIIIKPGNGEKGKGIYKIIKNNDDEFELNYQQSQEKVSLEQLNAFYMDKIGSTGRRYIVQKYITSTTPDGSPFDCRIHLEKNRFGKWAIPKIYVRIGLGQKVTSNISQGGGSSDAELFFNIYFKDKAEEILKHLGELGHKVAIKQEELRDTELMKLGVDVGVDEQGDLYIFETNGDPGTTRLRAEAALLRTDYYKYLLETK